MNKDFQICGISILLLLILCAFGFPGKVHANAPVAHEEAITVGTAGDYQTIALALEAVTPTRNKIILLDAVHTESGIRVDIPVEIHGKGYQDTIVEGASSVEKSTDRIFWVGKNGQLSLEGVTIRHGHVQKHPRAGAGVYNEGVLHVKNCVISDHQTTYGVGIFNVGTVFVENSILANNISVKRPQAEDLEGLGCAGSGGGIKVQRGHATLLRCVIQNNTAHRTGGGVKISCKASAEIIGCLISENTANDFGGGISAHGETRVRNTAVVFNRAQAGGGIHVTGDVEMVGVIALENDSRDFQMMTGNDSFSPEVLSSQATIIGTSQPVKWATVDTVQIIEVVLKTIL